MKRLIAALLAVCITLAMTAWYTTPVLATSDPAPLDPAAESEYILTPVDCIGESKHTVIAACTPRKCSTANAIPTLYKYAVTPGSFVQIDMRVHYFGADTGLVRQYYGAICFYSDDPETVPATECWRGCVTNAEFGERRDNAIWNDAVRTISLCVPQDARYLYICSHQYVPTVSTVVTEIPVLAEAPVVGAIYQGQALRDAPIYMGTVQCNGKNTAGTFSWADETLCPTVADSEMTNYEAVFTPTDSALPSVRLELTVPVYENRKDNVSAAIWRSCDDTRDLVPSGYFEENKDLYSCYSFNNIFSTSDYIFLSSPKIAARRTAAVLAKQAPGKRAISIEGLIERVFGGAITYGLSLYSGTGTAEAERPWYELADYVFFDTEMPDDSLYEPLGIPSGKSGCEVVGEKLRVFIGELSRIGIELDYVYGDFEQIEDICAKAYHRFIPRSGETRDDAMLRLYRSERFQDEILPQMLSRGFEPYSQEQPLKDVFAATLRSEQSGYYRINESVRIASGIWNAVFLNYTYRLQNTWIYDVIREKYPDAVCSDYYNCSSSGWINQSFTYEHYFGGNVDVGEKTYSCPALYGLLYSVDHLHRSETLSAYPQGSGFASLVGDINWLRNAVLSDGKTTAFICGQYYPTFNLRAWQNGASGSTVRPSMLTADGTNGYYRELLLHIWLHDPQQVIAYIYGKEITNLGLDEAEGIRASCDLIQELLDEINPLIGYADRKTLVTTLASEDDPFLISGMFANGKNVWRVTPNLSKDGLISESFLLSDGTEDGSVVFFAGGKTIVFQNAKLYEAGNSTYGYWVLTDPETVPTVTTEKDASAKTPAYDERFETFAKGTTSDGRAVFTTDKKADAITQCLRLYHYNGSVSQSGDADNRFLRIINGTVSFYYDRDVMLFGSFAEQQTWQLDVCFEALPEGDGVNVLGYSEDSGIKLKFLGDDVTYNGKPVLFGGEKISPNTWYTIRRDLDFSAVPNKTNIYIYENGTKPIGRVEGAAAGDAGPDSYDYNYYVGRIVLADTVNSSTAALRIDNFAICRRGENFKLEVYRKSDGIRVREGHEPFNASDPLLVKLNWLNYGERDTAYSILYEQLDDADTVLQAEVIAAQTVLIGDYGYRTVDLPRPQPNVGKVRISLLNGGTVLQSLNVALQPTAEHIHTYVDSVTAPTCTERGCTTHVCVDCGESYSDSFLDPLGHDTVDCEAKAATCTENGWDAYQACKRCDYTTYKETPALGHNIVTDKAVAATCTAAGLTEGCHCTGCSYAVGQRTLPALGHSYVEGVCVRCGIKEPSVGPQPIDCGGKASACRSSGFTDAPPYGNWAHSGIDFCLERGLFTGISEEAFSLNENMTRAMLVTVLYRLEGQPAASKSSSFTDVSKGKWFTSAVIWAAEAGIINSVGNGRFEPNGDVTREQIATILYRYADYKGHNVTASSDLHAFPDEASVSRWAKMPMSWAVAAGLVRGIGINGGTRLQPSDCATRAQVAAILMRYVVNGI